MKRLFIYLALTIGICSLYSCYKDLGNYSYKDVNKVVIGGVDTVHGYAVSLGDTLTIDPNLTLTLDAGGSHQYKYEWSWFDSRNGNQVISTEKNLRLRINKVPGPYTLQYKVTDSTTGVLFHIRCSVLVRTEVYEGYLVLSDVGGNSRLDMLSYDAISGGFTQYTDVLTKMHSSLPPQGQPYKVLATRVSNAFSFSDSTYGIYLVTASGTNRVHPETFDYSPTYNIRYEVAGNIAPDFKADNLISDPAFYFVSIYMVSDHNVYLRTGGVPLYNLPINKYVGRPIFKASDYIVSDGSGNATLFNMDDRIFAVTHSTNGTTVQDPPAAIPANGEADYPAGADLLWMAKSSTGYGYAVTKQGAFSKLSKFTPGSLPIYCDTIWGTDIDKATHFAVSANPEYLFYSVGAKVYEYDLYLKTSKLMLDKGSSEITYLSIQRFSPTAAGPKPSTYGTWLKWLTVGYADPGGTPGANGTLEQYSIPDANQALVLQKSWTGFGKIVSVSYRER